MHNALSFIQLDFITVKPYFTLKNCFIFSMLALIMSINSGTGASAIAILMFSSTLYISYPFAVCEQNGIDALYITLSIQRSTVVLGRYLFALVLNACAGLIAYVLSFAAVSLAQKGFNALESFAITSVMFLLCSIVQAVQLPVYFKLGYAKAKLLAYMPFLALALISLVISNSLKDSRFLSQANGLFGWFSSNLFMTVLCGGIIWLGIMIVSYRASLAYYGKRDF